MKFGNWIINNEGIEYSSSNLQKFVIGRTDLTEIVDIPVAEGPMYKWILLATEEDWLTEDDLYDLNFAFVFAAGFFGAGFDYGVFDTTVEYQFATLDAENDEDGI